MKKLMFLFILVGCTTTNRNDEYRLQIMKDSNFNGKQIESMLFCWEKLKNTYGCEELDDFKETIKACAKGYPNRGECWAACCFGEDNCK